MRGFFSPDQPAGTRILLIESGSRSLLETLIPHLKSAWGQTMPIDLVTCYSGVPAAFSEHSADGSVFRVSDYATPELRRQFLRELRSRNYAFAGMICAADPVMNRWKWWLAANVSAKFFIVNENGDYFWVDRRSLTIMRNFVLVRLGLSGAGSARNLARLLAFPFSVLYLLLYAGIAHLRRMLRLKLRLKLRLN